MPEKFKRLSVRLKRLSEHKRINIELFIERSEGGVCLPLWMRPKTARAMRRYISAVYTTNMATIATNIAAVARATTIKPKRELG
jgi:phage-related protein